MEDDDKLLVKYGARPGSMSKSPQLTLEKTGILWMILFVIFTLGLYVPYFFSKLEKATMKYRPTEYDFGWKIAFLYISIPLSILGRFLEFSIILKPNPETNAETSTLLCFFAILNLLSGIVVLVLAFQFRRILEDHFRYDQGIKIEFSWTFTCLFSVYYLQYKINQGIEELKGDRKRQPSYGHECPGCRRFLNVWIGKQHRCPDCGTLFFASELNRKTLAPQALKRRHPNRFKCLECRRTLEVRNSGKHKCPHCELLFLVTDSREIIELDPETQKPALPPRFRCMECQKPLELLGPGKYDWLNREKNVTIPEEGQDLANREKELEKEQKTGSYETVYPRATNCLVCGDSFKLQGPGKYKCSHCDVGHEATREGKVFIIERKEKREEWARETDIFPRNTACRKCVRFFSVPGPDNISCPFCGFFHEINADGKVKLPQGRQ